MVVDASALVSIMLGEPDADDLLQRLSRYRAPVMIPIGIYETALAVMRVKRCDAGVAHALVSDTLDALGIEVMSIGPAHAQAAVAAFGRFEKGRHAAELNMGDCFAYACALVSGGPLLCKGDDFSRTDAIAA